MRWPTERWYPWWVRCRSDMFSAPVLLVHHSLLRVRVEYKAMIPLLVPVVVYFGALALICEILHSELRVCYQCWVHLLLLHLVLYLLTVTPLCWCAHVDNWVWWRFVLDDYPKHALLHSYWPAPFRRFHSSFWFCTPVSAAINNCFSSQGSPQCRILTCLGTPSTVSDPK